MTRGLGCDIIEIARIGRACERERFLLRVYTQAERAHIAARGRTGAQTAAGLFAAKEAVSKALGTGFRGFGPADIDIAPDVLGKPQVVLTGGALACLRALGASRVLVSISHTNTHAMAVAVAEGECP